MDAIIAQGPFLQGSQQGPDAPPNRPPRSFRLADHHADNQRALGRSKSHGLQTPSRQHGFLPPAREENNENPFGKYAFRPDEWACMKSAIRETRRQGHRGAVRYEPITRHQVKSGTHAGLARQHGNMLEVALATSPVRFGKNPRWTGWHLFEARRQARAPWRWPDLHDGNQVGCHKSWLRMSAEDCVHAMLG